MIHKKTFKGELFMELVDRYQLAIFDLLYKVRRIQKEAIETVGKVVAEAIMHGHKVYLGEICHSIQADLLQRGGGLAFYKKYDSETELKEGDVLFVSSVSGRTENVVNLTCDSTARGVIVVALTSLDYSNAVEAVHPSGKKLFELATYTLDNCAPVGEAMLEIDGSDANFAAASGIASDFIMWSVTAVAVEELMKNGIMPSIYKSANLPGGMDYFNAMNERYEKYGW